MKTEQTKPNHTQLPWVYKHDAHSTRISPAHGQFRLAVLESCGDDEREANAKLICDSVNQHAALEAIAEAAERFLEELVGSPTCYGAENHDPETCYLCKSRAAVRDAIASWKESKGV